MKRIPLIGDAFLQLESRNQPLHIGVLMILGSMSTSRAESRKMPPLWETKRLRKQKKATPVVPAPALAGRIRMRSVTMVGGIIACRTNTPSSQHLLGYLDDALDELDSAVKRHSRARIKRKQAKKKASPIKSVQKKQRAESRPISAGMKHICPGREGAR